MMLALMLFVFVACQPATMELTEEQQAEIMAEMKAMVDGW
jgi:hypothetical protein